MSKIPDKNLLHPSAKTSAHSTNTKHSKNSQYLVHQNQSNHEQSKKVVQTHSLQLPTPLFSGFQPSQLHLQTNIIENSPKNSVKSSPRGSPRGSPKKSPKNVESKKTAQPDQQIQQQHRLKLKDYLRLATITKRASSQSAKKDKQMSRKKAKQEQDKKISVSIGDDKGVLGVQSNMKTHEKGGNSPTSAPVMKKNQSLDTQASLKILKSQLKSDLKFSMQKLQDLIQRVEKEDSNINTKVGSSEQQRCDQTNYEYEQLVFTCQLHRIIKQSLMGSIEKANSMINTHKHKQYLKFAHLAKQMIGSQIKKSSIGSGRKRERERLGRTTTLTTTLGPSQMAVVKPQSNITNDICIDNNIESKPVDMNVYPNSSNNINIAKPGDKLNNDCPLGGEQKNEPKSGWLAASNFSLASGMNQFNNSNINVIIENSNYLGLSNSKWIQQSNYKM